MTLLFKPRHIEAIRTGEKTVTRRVWADNYPRPNPGSVVIAAYNRDDLDKSPIFTTTLEADCFIEIVDVYQEPLGEMTDADARKEGEYETVDEFRGAWEQINGQGSWDPDEVVDVVPFEYAGRNPSGGDANVAV